MSGAQASKHRLSRPDLAAEILLDLVKQKVEEAHEARAAALAPPRRPRKPLYLAGLFVLFLGLTGWNVVRVTQPTEFYTPQEWEASLRFRLYLAVQAIEEYRDSAGVFPTTLVAAGVNTEDFSFSATGSTYTIVAQGPAGPLRYRRGDALTPFSSAYARLPRGAQP